MTIWLCLLSVLSLLCAGYVSIRSKFLFVLIVANWYVYVFLCNSSSHEPDIKPPRGMVHF